MPRVKLRDGVFFFGGYRNSVVPQRIGEMVDDGVVRE